MLLLLVEAGGARYGIEASRIVEVIPAPVLRHLPGVPAYVAGVFSYYGHLLPVVDLSALLTGHAAQVLLSTRVIVLNIHPARAAEPVLLGLLAEHATETLACNREEFQPVGIQRPEAPYAGNILVRPDGLIQELNVDRVLTADVQDQLFGVSA